MKNLLLTISLLLFGSNAKAQMCFFCSEEELIKMFNEYNYSYDSDTTNLGVKYYYIMMENHTQIYYLHSNENTIYAIVTENKSTSKELYRQMCEKYTKLSSTTWQSDYFDVIMETEKRMTSFAFIYK
jgi:hypothetical protein